MSGRHKITAWQIRETMRMIRRLPPWSRSRKKQERGMRRLAIDVPPEPKR